jgi:hypothetical protein
MGAHRRTTRRNGRTSVVSADSFQSTDLPRWGDSSGVSFLFPSLVWWTIVSCTVVRREKMFKKIHLSDNWCLDVGLFSVFSVLPILLSPISML